MEKSVKDGQDAVVAYLNAAEVLQPRHWFVRFSRACGIGAAFVCPRNVAISDVLAVGSDELRARAFQSHSQRIGVIAAIGNDAPEMGTRSSTSRPRYPHLLERALREPALGNLRRRKLRSDRYAAAVDHHHALRTFPATCFADPGAPFLAVMKVASRKAFFQSSNRRWSNMDNRFCHAASQNALTLPTFAIGANRSNRSGTPRADRAIWPRYEEPKEYLPNRLASMPKGGHVHLCAASALKQRRPISSIAPLSKALPLLLPHNRSSTKHLPQAYVPSMRPNPLCNQFEEYRL